MTTTPTQDELTTALRSLARAFVPDGNNSLSDEVIDFIIKSTGVIEFINRHYTANDAIPTIVTAAFKESTYTNIEGDSKYWSAEGDYNKMATNKFFPQEWYDAKLLPNIQKRLNLDTGTETGK